MGIHSVPWPHGHGSRRVHAKLVCLVMAALAVAACEREAANERVEEPRPQQAGQPVNPVKLAAHLRAARVAAVTGNSKAAEEHIKTVATDLTRSARMPDPYLPIDHEAARLAVRSIEGVRTSLWLDRENFVVMVGGQQHRSMQTIDRVCVALEPLGDTLAVVVNVQDVTGKDGDEAETLSRNCQLPEGQRAFLQAKRQVDVVAPEVREQFKRMQGKAK